MAGTGSGLEIERKYLLSGMPRAEWRARYRIRQGYVPGTAIRERVRSQRNGDELRFFRTLKAGQGVARMEIEEEIDAALFRGLWRLTRGRRVQKWRYVAEHDGVTWEVDRFIGRDLVLAEVELDEEAQVVSVPPWLERVLVREVTDDRAFANSSLAQ